MIMGTAGGGVLPAFGARLRAAQDRLGPLCVGIDPHPSLLTGWGLSDDAAGLESFALAVVETLAEQVAVFKPQSAFFERHGSRGIAVLERVIAAARAAGVIVLLDVKRGDLGSTMQGYADAYLDPASPLFCDAITVSPYLGFGSLAPAMDTAAANGCGVFVLGLTSNPEGPQVQHAVGPDGRTVARTIIDAVSLQNAGEKPMGCVGLVVGATIANRTEVDAYDFGAVNGPLLAPGIGTQGGRPEQLPAIFGAALRQVVPSVSREVLSAGPDAAALREAAGRLNAECWAALG